MRDEISRLTADNQQANDGLSPSAAFAFFATQRNKGRG
jgi:hypothetical protein